MKKSFVIGIALAASALTACGSGTDGAATSSSTTSSPSSSASVTSPSTEESTSAAETTEETTTSDETSATGEPVTLDEQSVAWFSTFCGSVTSIETSSEKMSTMQPDQAAAPTEQQALLAAGVTEYGQTFKTAATDIAAVPAATIEGGDELATGATTAFNQIGDAMIAAADKFAQTPVTDQASLQSAATTLGTDVQASAAGIQESLAPLQTILTPELGASVKEIPGCEKIAA